jgi:hypothetical protein
MRHDPKARLILPGEYLDSTGLLRLPDGGPPVLGLKRAESEAIDSLLGGDRVVAMMKPPSFFDHVFVYATWQALYDFLLDPELRAIVSTETVRPGDVIARLEEIPFEPAMRFLSGLQKQLAFGRIDRECQTQLTWQIYRNSPITHAALRFLNAHSNGVIFSEQQLFATQRLLVMHASDEPANSLTPEQLASLTLALLYVPGTVLTEEDDLAVAPEYVGEERWLRYFVGMGGFVANGWLKHEMARSHQLYSVFANSRLAKQHHSFVPLNDLVRNAYDMTFAELQAFGFVLHSGAQMLSQAGPPLAVTPAYFSTSALAANVGHGFSAIAETRDWYREQFTRSRENPRRAAYEIQPFLRRPGLVQGDGNVLTVAPRAIEGWLSPAGWYYRFVDLAKAQSGDNLRQRFSIFNGLLHEMYARQLVHAAHPYPRARKRAFGIGLVSPAREYKIRKQTFETTDVALDLGLDLVLFEVTAKRVSERSLTEANAESVRNDLRMMIEDKMKQLGRVIGDVWDDPARMPDVELTHIQRVWPIVVVGDGLFQNPSIWEHIQNSAGHYLDHPRSRVNASIQPVILIDLEELEMLMGIVSEGHSLTEILERKVTDLWVSRDMKSLIHDEFGHRWSGSSRYVEQGFHKAFAAITDAINLPEMRRVSELQRHVA